MSITKKTGVDDQQNRYFAVGITPQRDLRVTIVADTTDSGQIEIFTQEKGSETKKPYLKLETIVDGVAQPTSELNSDEIRYWKDLFRTAEINTPKTH